MGKVSAEIKSRLRRKRRVRKKVHGTVERPRLTVFRSARHIYVQVINDDTGNTLVSASSLDKEVQEHPPFENKQQAAQFVGKLAAERALSKGIAKAVFDRNGYLYHGRVKAVSTGAREGGLNF